MSRRVQLVAGLVSALAAAALGAGLAWSAFVATSSSTGNTFSAASCFGSQQRIATGSYSGDGTSGRSITAGFQPEVVIVKADTGQIGVMRTATMAGDASKQMVGAIGLSTQRVQSLTATGFAVGNNAQVNQSGITYRWTALGDSCSTLQAGSYTGNGAAGRAIAGLGFQPELVIVMGATGQRAVHRYAGMTSSWRFNGGAGVANEINSLDADGFTVGNGAAANANGVEYHYVAFNALPGSIFKGSYTGNNTDNRNITGVGFQPDYVMVQTSDSGTGRTAHHRPAALTGMASQDWPASGNIFNGIQALQADGFQVGTDVSVNAAGATYHYLAFGNGAGGCALPSTQTLSATSDSWVDEASGNSNNGTDTMMAVVSRTFGRNMRGLVRFNLPALPAGCSVTGASLRLYDRTPTGGRTIEAYANGAAWTENGVTWNNQPATTGAPSTATSPAAAGWMQWDVTPQVQGMYAGSNYGFKLRDETESEGLNYQLYDSREAGAATGPQLILDIG